MSLTSEVNPPLTVQALFAQADAIAPILEEGAAEAEKLRRLGDDSVAALRSTDLLRLWCPAELGGFDATVREGIETIAKVTEIDTAAGWNLAVCAIGTGFAGAYLGDEAVVRIFSEDLPMVAGTTAPVGHAVRCEDGLQVSGSWSFASGIQLARWVKAGVMIQNAEGPPTPAIVVVPVTDVAIDTDSWQVAGLIGSGSCDFAMDGVRVPAGYWYGFPVAERRRGGPTFQLPLPGQFAILHAGFALGAATRALREATDLARTKIRQFDDATMSSRQTFRRDLAEQHACLSAARLYAYDTADRLQAAAGTSEAFEALGEMRAASRFANDVALDVATWAFRSGGASALRLDHPLQRILRDLLAATQHIFIDDRAYTDFGTALLKPG